MSGLWLYPRCRLEIDAAKFQHWCRPRARTWRPCRGIPLACERRAHRTTGTSGLWRRRSLPLRDSVIPQTKYDTNLLNLVHTCGNQLPGNRLTNFPVPIARVIRSPTSLRTIFEEPSTQLAATKHRKQNSNGVFTRAPIKQRLSRGCFIKP